MGERRDLRNLLKDTDFTQKRIIDDLAGGPDVESDYPKRGVARDIKRSEGGDFLKNIFVGLLLVGIVVGSFWISFLIGKKVLVPPVKNLPTFEMPTPKPISKAEVESAAPAKEEAAVSEREIKEAEAKAGLPKPVAKTSAVKSTAPKYYKVIVGTNMTIADANALIKRLKKNGFQAYGKKISGLYRVQAGAFDAREKANPLVVKLKSKGFTPTVIVE